jgi:hypothetical protein
VAHPRPQQLQPGGVRALLDALDRLRGRVGDRRRRAVLQVDLVDVRDQFQHLGRIEVIGHPAAKLGGNVELPVAVCARSAKPAGDGAGGQTAGVLLFAGRRRTQLDLLLQDRASPGVDVVPFINQQHFGARRLQRELIAGENSRRARPYDNDIVLVHDRNLLHVGQSLVESRSLNRCTKKS